ncbi:hypothetical protein RSOLAG22IIIB_02874 [Rhizoctonia solani]|uniref:Uncharacterized protein n=1 Tax=Rhizoctonia solani TaxID=456999 RepID=A0A0K6FL58_9AGAM|nr:hypothetical protein RSOLAG22IIIB_02874 [Rhizoctonia solani]
MRISIANTRQYHDSGSEELDRRENVQLMQEIASHILPRSPRGGGGKGGGSKGGGKSGGSKGGSSNGSSGGSSSGSSGGSSSSSTGSRGGVSFSNGRGSSTRGNGGGSTSTISSGVFAGRTVGGGTRNQVYGSSRYGSGYTYANGGSSVAGRGFPFGYWPVYVPVAGGAAYYGYREYGPGSNTSRPGGEMQQALVRSTSWPTANARRWLGGRQSGNSTNSTMPAVNNATASYYIVGDADTIAAVMDELVTACSVVRTSGIAINETNPSIYYEQAVQFYRASSFMLLLTSYNNTANIPINGTEPSTTIPDTPLPPGTDMNFLSCLNTTIGASIPIMDAENTASSNSAAMNLQSLGGMNVIGLLWVLLWLFKLL